MFTTVCGDRLHTEAAAEQYRPSSRYSINVIIARHESSVSREAEAHARLLYVYPWGLSQRVTSTLLDTLLVIQFKKINIMKHVGIVTQFFQRDD